VRTIGNTFRIRINNPVTLYMYSWAIQPDSFMEMDKARALFKYKNRMLEAALGAYMLSGPALWCTTPLEENFVLDFKFRDQDYTIIIDVSNPREFIMKNDASIREMPQLANMLINVIIKQTFRETHLRQIGKRPHFFDTQNTRTLEDVDLRVWSGFKATAALAELGLTLSVDSILKFMTTKTVLDRIRELQEESHNKGHFLQLVQSEFLGKTVVADWGTNRQYIVHEIDFTQNPTSC